MAVMAGEMRILMSGMNICEELLLELLLTLTLMHTPIAKEIEMPSNS